jgi:hypothetical protein
MMVDLFSEAIQIKKLADQLRTVGYDASNSTLVAVSSDYSSIAWQVLRHQLSHDGEVCDGFTVDVPYPDQQWDVRFELKILKDCVGTDFKENLILIEAGVIRGSNYKRLTELLAKTYPDQKVVTATLYENTHSAFKSDYVAEYYDDTVSDLTFWWEVYNKHWK